MKTILVIIVIAVLLIAVYFVQNAFVPQHNESLIGEQVQTQDTVREPKKIIADETIQSIVEETSPQKQAENNFMDNYTANLAADNFFGFYFANTRARKLFCDSQGVDISAYVNIFADLHISQYIKAKSIYQKAQANEERVWEEIRESTLKKIPDAMQKMADHFGITIEQACQLFSENPDDLANRMHYSNSFPDAYLTLMKTDM